MAWPALADLRKSLAGLCIVTVLFVVWVVVFQTSWEEWGSTGTDLLVVQPISASRACAGAGLCAAWCLHACGVVLRRELVVTRGGSVAFRRHSFAWRSLMRRQLRRAHAAHASSTHTRTPVPWPYLPPLWLGTRFSGKLKHNPCYSTRGA